MNASTRRRLGRSLIALGLLVIVVAVIWVLEVANGPGTGPKTFAERRSYDQVKEALHGVFPQAFAVGRCGLGIALLGGRFATREETGAS